MAQKTWSGIVVVALVCLVMTLCFFAYQKGVDDGELVGFIKGKAQAAQVAQAENYYTLPEQPDTTEELAKSLIEGLKSANVTFEYDQSGYSKGIITLYWEK